jgi:apolipoprotein N-acyltransferase
MANNSPTGLIHSDINPNKSRHSRESGNPGKNWIPGQARNDKRDKIYVVMYKSLLYVRDFLLVSLSSLLLIFSFPKFDLGFLAWVGLLPLLIAINGKRLKNGFFLSILCGILFFLGIFHWILTYPKFILLQQIPLALYLGSFFGLFGLAFNFISTRLSPTLALWAAPFIWVSLEYTRSNLSFLALPWGLLAHSQHGHPTIIQIASITGTYSLSFLIVMVNGALGAIIYPYLSKFSEQKIPPTHPFPKGGGLTTAPFLKGDSGGFGINQGQKALLALTALLIVLTLLYGQLTISKPILGNSIKVSLVQGNIEQAKKWDPKYADEIMQIYAELTQEVSKDQPTLIIWPETATPGAITLNPRLYMEVINIAKKAGTYLLFGSAQHQKFEKKGTRKSKLLNSAYLLNPGPAIAEIHRYDKIRLFPFAEYLPYQDTIPWSLIKVGDSDTYTPGKQFTVFELLDFRFGVVICWEDIFPDLFRQFVERGAQFMVNITNEARFGKTAAPHQLASISVFRAIENRIFVVRCANTGVSCIIDPYGRIIDRVKDEQGQDIFIRGVMSGWIIPLDSKTIYTQYGDLLVWVAFLGASIFLATAIVKGLKKN